MNRLLDLIGGAAGWRQTDRLLTLTTPAGPGHISGVERLGANGGFARYRLRIEPWLAFLDHNVDNYLFQDKSVIEIVDELLGDWHGRGKHG